MKFYILQKETKKNEQQTEEEFGDGSCE